jgi:DNA-binding MarR family transcriptional regulator
MSDHRDPIDAMRARLAELYPDLDTAPFGVTGRVIRLAAWLERQRADHLEAFDLTPGDFDVLATIRRTEGEIGVNPRELVAAVLITSGGLTKRLDRLESAGLIGRHADPGDRRGTRVRLTAEGTDLIDRALRSVLTHERNVVAAALTERQVDQASTLLRKLTT